MCSTSSSSATTTTTSSSSLRSSSSSLSQHQPLRRLQRQGSSSLSEVSWHLTTGSLASLAVVFFSLYLPFVLAPWAARETYHWAWYHYDADLSHFDNTLWTYGTDYLLAIGMILIAARIGNKQSTSTLPQKPSSSTTTRRLIRLSRGLLWCYGVSVTAGGWAHQFYITLDHRNSLSFRCWWSLCVGSVCLASIFMGCIGSELVRFDQCESEYYGYYDQNNTTNRRYLLVIPDWFWLAYGTMTTLICLAGGMSFQRPACDLFIAGITQFPSTFYMMTILLVGLPTHANRWLSQRTRWMGVLGFILNAPLLPLYPLLVQYTNWSLGSVNTFLHTWLLVAWGLQGWILRCVEASLVQRHELSAAVGTTTGSTLTTTIKTPPPFAIPVPTNPASRALSATVVMKQD